MAKRRTSKKRTSRKPRKAAPRRRASSTNARKAMARKAPKRRRKSTSRTAPRRRTSRRASGGKIMDMVMPILLAGGGYLAAEYILPKLLAGQSAKVRALAASGGALGLAMFMPQFAPIAIGIGAQGVVAMGRDLLKLPAPGAGIRGLNDRDRRIIQRMADSGMVNGRDTKFVNGVKGQAAGLVNGYSDLGCDIDVLKLAAYQDDRAA